MSSSSAAAASDDDTGNDELVSSFMAFTSCSDPSRAASYLEMSGGDLQTAVGLYMEHEQGGSDHPGAGRGGGPSGGGAASSSSPGSYGGGGGGPVRGDFDVRAPDETRTMRLMDDQMMAADPTLQLMNAMMEEQLARTAFASLSDHHDRRGFDARAAVNAAAAGAGAGAGDSDDENFHYEDDEDEDDDEVQIVPPAAASSAPPAPRLNDLFAAPDHLTYKTGGFAGARAAAKDAKRWLLVNIQRDAEFSSHALNRDVWRDELVENLIREGFIFWQVFDLSQDGRTFVEHYQVNDFPHISIIDPRTARLLWRKEGWTQQNPVTAASFAEMAMDFCSRNTFDRPPQAPRPPGGAGGSASGFRPPQKRPVQEMTEDEQLQEAMRASMQDASSIPVQDGSDDDDDDDEVQVVDASMDVASDDAKASPAGKKATNSLIGELLALRVEDEPATGSRLALRMPDGKRVVRKFAPTDTVKTVYAYFAQSSDEVRGGRDFTLMAGFPPSDLILDLDRSVDDCKLAGQQITVRWKEE